MVSLLGGTLRTIGLCSFYFLAFFFLLHPTCVTGMVPCHLKSGVLSLAFPPVGAASTQERRRDFTAPLAFHIHKVRTAVLHQATFLVFPLLLFRRGMKEILRERYVLVGVITPEKAIF